LLRQFLDRWADAGDVGDFLSEVPRHARWLDADWTSYGKALAEAGQYRAATETFLAHLPAPVVPPATMSAPEAMARYQNSPRDPWAALQAYVAETGAGQRDQAIETLRTATQNPGAPASLSCLLARLLLDENRDEDAWKAVSTLGNPSAP
jgi:predicted Zn-dependent protease